MGNCEWSRDNPSVVLSEELISSLENKKDAMGLFPMLLLHKVDDTVGCSLIWECSGLGLGNLASQLLPNFFHG